MRKNLISIFCLFLVAVSAHAISAQKKVVQSKIPVVSTAETRVRQDAKRLSWEQKELVRKALGILDESDVLFFTARDADKFQLNIRRVIPLLDELQTKLPNGPFYDALNSTILAYMDFGILIQIVGIRHEKGELAFDDKVTGSLAEIAKRYEKVLGTSSSTDMLDPDIGAKLLLFGVGLKKSVYKLIPN